ncbi:MAG: helix-turn-helix domain-containing protein [Burkholderiales bacterium]|jgi:predicted transcriptional regulator|nr:helix-turn-helix domain-containing protein [Burkholderiales bacterium]
MTTTPTATITAATTLKVGIASYEDMKARTMAIARGELRPKAGDPQVWFTSPESFARLLSNKNRALLALIAETRPESLHELADRSGRTPGNLSRTLRTMERYGLVRLHRGSRGMVRPEVAYRDVQLQMTLG